MRESREEGVWNTLAWDSRLDRRELIRWSAVLAAGATPLASALSACSSDHAEPATVRAGFQDWILRLHPAIEQSVGPAYARTHAVPATQRGGVNASRLVVDAREKRSDWDVYIGMTPFQDLVNLVEAEAIEPWDRYIPGDALNDIHPAIRREVTFAGKLYAWPFLLDVSIQGWNIELVERAGLDPGRPPSSWAEYVDNARKVVRVGAAPYGCTFDPRPSRSLVPIAYTFKRDVYTEDGLFDYEDDAVLEALELLRQMHEIANPDVLDPQTSAGAGITSDEGAFVSQLAAYYVKYQNAHVRSANTWPDPTRLALASLPGLDHGSAAPLFLTTTIVLTRYGRNKQAAAAYARALTHDDVLWRQSIGSGRQGAGQLPCFDSLWQRWETEQPAWVPEWATQTFKQLRRAAPIRPHRLGINQFSIAQPFIEQYLTREESSPRRALKLALAAVRKRAA
jgi:multiple sugar transport system substrate-binding protein